MTLPANDHANRELSIGELEAVAGGLMADFRHIADPIHYLRLLPAPPSPPRPWMGGLPGRGGANGNPF
jgi:hypothetical protein